MFATGKPPADIISEKGLRQNSDSSELESFCMEAIRVTKRRSTSSRPATRRR